MSNENKDNEILGGSFGKPIRQSKLVNTKMLKAKLNSHLDKAINIMTQGLDNPKMAYGAAKDLLAAYVTLSNLEMKEELHRAEMKFKHYKNKINEEELEQNRKQELIDSTGGTTEVPQAKFSMEYKDNFS